MYKKHHLDYRDFISIMQSKNYAQSTIDNYSYYIKLFLEYTDKPRTKISQTDIEKYMYEIRLCDNSVKNQTISAIRIFFKYVLRKKIADIVFERPRKNKKLPRVIDWNELTLKIDRIKNIKQRAILSIASRCALRVSEVCSIKIEDVDTERKLILVRNSKGNKDRYVPMSDELLQLLFYYCEEYDPKEFLFSGQFGGKYSVSSCQKIFKRYIDTTKSFHTLRHSGATQMLNNKTNLRTIQSVLGHASSRTTEIYTHVSNELLRAAAL